MCAQRKSFFAPPDVCNGSKPALRSPNQSGFRAADLNPRPRSMARRKNGRPFKRPMGRDAAGDRVYGPGHSRGPVASRELRAKRSKPEIVGRPYGSWTCFVPPDQVWGSSQRRGRHVRELLELLYVSI